MSKRLGEWLNRRFPKKKKPAEEWVTPPESAKSEEKPAEPQEWKSTDHTQVPGPRTAKRALSTLLALVYAAAIFTVPMDTFTAGLTLCTVYILLDYMMMTRR